MAYNSVHKHPRFERRRIASTSFGIFVRVKTKQRGTSHDDAKYKSEDYIEICRKTPPLITLSSINLQLERLNPAVYEKEVFSEPKPNKDTIRVSLEKQAEDEIKSVFWWKNKRARQKFVEDNLAIQYDAQLISWQRKKNDFIAKHEASKRDCEEKRVPLLKLLSPDEKVITQGLIDAANSLEIPNAYGLDFFFDSVIKTVFVDIDLPDAIDIHSLNTSSIRTRSFGMEKMLEIQHNYIRSICGIAFYTAGELFNVNTGIKNIQISEYLRSLNRPLGADDENYLLSVFFDRESFSKLNLGIMDPEKSIMDFPVRIKPSNSEIVSTILPFPAPGDSGFKRGEKPHEGYSNVRLASSIYPTDRVVFESTVIMGDYFENVIRHRIPKYDFGVGELAERFRKTPYYFKRDVQEVLRIQQHFNSVLQAAEKFEKENNYEKACYYYEQLLLEKYYDPQPIDRLIQLYEISHLIKAKMEVLKEAIAHFKSLKQERELYLDALSKRMGMPGAARDQIERGQVISYYGIFDLYNPFNIISDWEKELKRLNEMFTIRPYTKDASLPSHGRRRRADNKGTVRVRISRRSGIFYSVGPNGFDLYLNIRLANKTYYATLESEDELGKKTVMEISVPTKVIEDIVVLSNNTSFLSLKDEEIFPDIAMLDGYDVLISVKTDSGDLTLESNMLDETLSNGIIEFKGEDILTPFHQLAQIAFDKLGIRHEEFEEEDNPL